MVIRPRRPVTADFLEIENLVKEQAFTLYNFKWKPDAEVIKGVQIKLSQCMRFPKMWHLDMCRLRRACAASF